MAALLIQYLSIRFIPAHVGITFSLVSFLFVRIALCIFLTCLRVLFFSSVLYLSDYDTFYDVVTCSGKTSNGTKHIWLTVMSRALGVEMVALKAQMPKERNA
jgi:hypothetical protein